MQTPSHSVPQQSTNNSNKKTKNSGEPQLSAGKNDKNQEKDKEMPKDKKDENSNKKNSKTNNAQTNTFTDEFLINFGNGDGSGCSSDEFLYKDGDDFI